VKLRRDQSAINILLDLRVRQVSPDIGNNMQIKIVNLETNVNNQLIRNKQLSLVSLVFSQRLQFFGEIFSSLADGKALIIFF